VKDDLTKLEDLLSIMQATHDIQRLAVHAMHGRGHFSIDRVNDIVGHLRRIEELVVKHERQPGEG
jgi:hypothetical protein